MPTPVWPSTLPQSLPVGMPEEYIDGRGSFQPDAGPVRTLVQYTATPQIIRPRSQLYSAAQWNVLVTFFDTTLAHGQREFDWTNPWYGAGAVRFRFHDRPQPTWLRGRWSFATADLAGGSNPQRLVEVTFSLIRLPWWPATG